MSNPHSWYDFMSDRIKALNNINYTPKKVLDIGANIGQFHDMFTSIFPDVEILNIEGNVNCEKYLKEKNLNYKICMLSNSEKLATFYRNAEANDPKGICGGSSLFKEKTEYYANSQEIKVNTTTLDSIIPPSMVYDYIKLDVQGAELDIIKGGLHTILKSSFLQLELSILEYNEGAPLIGDIISFLNPLGFKVYDIGSLNYWNGKLNQSDFLFINSNKLNHKLEL
mgnify:CR=1 FL=1|tara:strand:- start:225 stop:899 length:675 start_codon:yes stop_codon:yes gene_type:complete